MANSGTDSNKGVTPPGAPIASDVLKTDVNAVANEAKNVLAKVTEEGGAQLSQLADQAKDTVADVTNKAKGIATEQKELLAAQIGGVADAMARVATDLETIGGASAPYARIIADNAEQLSSTVRDNDVDQLMNRAQGFGRQQPVAFLGAAALLGFAASRFLLASAQRSQQPSSSAQTDRSAPTISNEPGRV